ncbi:MAG: hypothetical protein JHC26_07520 [Thermofilum sp.]|nr:hypothetical protein [Thermofilum sp.]
MRDKQIQYCQKSLKERLAPISRVNELFINMNYDEMSRMLREYLLNNKLLVITESRCPENFVENMNNLMHGSLKWTATLLLRREYPRFLTVIILEKSDALMNTLEKFLDSLLDRDDIKSMYAMLIIAMEPECKKMHVYPLFDMGDVDTNIDVLIRAVLVELHAEPENAQYGEGYREIYT